MSQTLNLVWTIRAFHYAKVRPHENNSKVPLQKGPFYVHFEKNQSLSDATVSCTLKVAKSRSSECPETIVLDLPLYSTLPKINSIPAVNAHRKDNIVIVTHRDLNNSSTVQAYCRLMLLLASDTDACDLISHVSSVCDSPSTEAPLHRRTGPLPTLDHASTQGHLFGQCTSPLLSSQIDILEPTIQANSSSAYGAVTEGGSQARRDIEFGHIRRPAHKSSLMAQHMSATRRHELVTIQNESQEPVNIYEIESEELQPIVASIVREEGFADLMDKMKMLSPPARLV